MTFRPFKLKPEVKAFWVAALESDEYEQTRSHLCDKKGHCCLGVLAEELIKRKLVKAEFREMKNSTLKIKALVDLETFFTDERLPPAIIAEAAFQELPPNWTDEDVWTVAFEDSVSGTRTLYDLNDDKMSFKRIAKIIREQM